MPMSASEIEKLIKCKIERETAIVPQQPARAARVTHHESHERSAPFASKPKTPSRDPWFDKPYEPSDSTPSAEPPKQVANKQKANIPALLVPRQN